MSILDIDDHETIRVLDWCIKKKQSNLIDKSNFPTHKKFIYSLNMYGYMSDREKQYFNNSTNSLTRYLMLTLRTHDYIDGNFLLYCNSGALSLYEYALLSIRKQYKNRLK